MFVCVCVYCAYLQDFASGSLSWHQRAQDCLTVLRCELDKQRCDCFRFIQYLFRSCRSITRRLPVRKILWCVLHPRTACEYFFQAVKRSKSSQNALYKSHTFRTERRRLFILCLHLRWTFGDCCLRRHA